MSGIVLDTNAISETMREKPNAHLKFTEWYTAQNLDQLYLTSISIAELWQGVTQLDSTNPKRAYYFHTVEFTEKQYEGRILSFGHEAARIWGKIRGEQKRMGNVRPELDLQIAAIVHHHNMALATGNTKHFAGLGLDVINPFKRM